MKKRLLCALMAAVILFGIVAAVPPARAASELTVSQELVDMLKKFEGFLKYPVWDNRQYSMGYGTYCSPDEYEYYKEHGITEEEVIKLCGKHTVNQIQADEIALLLGFAQSLKDGDTTVEELMAPFRKGKAKTKGASAKSFDEDVVEDAEAVDVETGEVKYGLFNE